MNWCRDGFNDNLFISTFDNVRRLFFGEYPGYRASNTKYHDFEHTCSVVLATNRLICGSIIDGQTYCEETIFKGIMAALFHDAGLIQTEEDTTGTGAKYTVGHEERSVSIMRMMLEGHIPEENLQDITDCIKCTILAESPDNIPFRSEDVRAMGRMLGSADLLAQMADRCYLEKLLLLFEEFQEAGLPGYETPMDMFKKTRAFYQNVARKRLDGDLGKVDRHMLSYFKCRCDTERDLYAEAIERNLNYLDAALMDCNEDLVCFVDSLRRGDVVDDTVK